MRDIDGYLVESDRDDRAPALHGPGSAGLAQTELGATAAPLRHDVAAQPRAGRPGSRDFAAVMALQRSVGNAAVAQRLSTGTLPVVSRDGEEDEAQPAPDVAATMGTSVSAAAEATTHDPNFLVAGSMSTVNDSRAAAHLIGEIQTGQPVLEQTPAWKDASGSNVTAIATLEQLVSENDIQGAAVSQFKQQYQQSQIDFNRMDAAFQTFDAQNGAGLGKAKTPEEMAQKITKGAELTSFDDQRMKKDIGEGGPTHALWLDARNKKNELRDTSALLGTQQSSMIAKTHSLNGLQGQMQAGVLAAQASADPDKKKALDGVKAKSEATKKLWAAVSSKLAEPAKAAATAANPVAGKAVGLAIDKVPELIDLWFSSAMATAALAAENSKDHNQLTSVAAAGSMLAAAKNELEAAVRAYAASTVKLEEVKKDYLAAMDKLGAKLDGDLKTGNHAYAQLSKLISESTSFVAQADAALATGRTELEQQKQVNAVRDKVVDPSSGKALPWFSTRPRTALEEEAGVFKGSPRILVRNEVTLGSISGSNVTGTGAGKTQGGSAFGAGGANELIQNQITQLEAVRGKADGIRQILEKKLDF